MFIMKGKKSSVSARRKIMTSGVLIGIGVMALVDEIIFHQLLQWHHFFDFDTTQFGIFSDGLLNSFALFAIVAGIFLFAHVVRIHTYSTVRWAAGLFLGMGAFQLFDGIVSHKVLRIHQIRYNVDLLPYDIAWISSAILLLAIGGFLWYRVRKNDPAVQGD
ncbi:uncharacterized membrane protein [Salinicoccus kekensis]|uniref:Uncharacterized membrane protein n=2 Tax=Salinicoccus kekensis TaxID=714307 RepID=A0A285UGJ8_9STAP|nr:uncharacterized membrane protein [Salinicoccus kekensis]